MRWWPTPLRARRSARAARVVRRVVPARRRACCRSRWRWPCCWRSPRRCRCRRDACPTSPSAPRKQRRGARRLGDAGGSHAAAGQGSRSSGRRSRSATSRSAAGGTGAATSGDLSAIFKDTSLATQRPDFNSFLKKGDERLKLLEQADRLPDLQSDFTTSQYKMVFRKSKALTGGLRPDQISPQKLRELLEEMERLGRKGGATGAATSTEGMEALEGGQTDRAHGGDAEGARQDARAWTRPQRSGKGLRGRPRDRPRARAAAIARGGEGGGPGGPGLRRGRGAAAGQGPERLAEGRGDPAAARQPLRRRRRGRVAPGAQGRLRHQPDRAGRQHGLAPAVSRRHRAVPEDDGGRDHAGAGAARLPSIRSGTTSRRSTSDRQCRRPRATSFFTPEFLAQLERLSLLSRRSFRGRRQGRAAQSAPRPQRRVLPTTAPTASATTSATSTGTSTAASIACTSSSSSTRRTSACTCSSTPRPRWTSARRPSSTTRSRMAAALGFVGLVNHERVGVGVLRERVAEGWPPTRGRNQITASDRLPRRRASRRARTSLNEGLANYADARARAGPGGGDLGSARSRRLRDAACARCSSGASTCTSSTCSTPEEMNPELAGDLRLIDSETGEMRELTVDGEAAARRTASGCRQFLERVETFCRTHGDRLSPGDHRHPGRGLRARPAPGARARHELPVPARSRARSRCRCRWCCSTSSRCAGASGACRACCSGSAVAARPRGLRRSSSGCSATRC